MKKTLDYEKLDKMKVEIQGLIKDIKMPDVEDMPIETFEPPRGFSELTEEEFEYLVFGVKPEWAPNHL